MSLVQSCIVPHITGFPKASIDHQKERGANVIPRSKGRTKPRKRPEFTFHAENQYASGTRKRPRGLRADPRAGPLIMLEAPLNSLISVQQRAYDFFIVCHLGSIDNSAQEGKDPDSLRSFITGNHTELISKIVAPLSMALFVRSGRSTNGLVEANASYTALLPQLRSALLGLEPADIEAYLAVILLMGLYEDAVYQDNLQPAETYDRLRSARHHDGLLALLARWNELRRPPTAIVRHARRACLKAVLIRGKDFPEPLRDGRLFGERGLDLKHDRIMTRILAARKPLYKSPHLTDVPIDDLQHELRELDVLLQSWTLEFPSDWRLRAERVPSQEQIPNLCFCTNTIHVCETQAAAAMWVKYYSSRILLSGMRLDALDLAAGALSSVQYAERQELQAIIAKVALDLASTLPFILRRPNLSLGQGFSDTDTVDTEVDLSYASGLITPIVIASVVRHVDVKLRMWFKLQLTDIGNHLGYGLLQSTARREWLVF